MNKKFAAYQAVSFNAWTTTRKKKEIYEQFSCANISMGWLPLVKPTPTIHNFFLSYVASLIVDVVFKRLTTNCKSN